RQNISHVGRKRRQRFFKNGRCAHVCSTLNSAKIKYYAQSFGAVTIRACSTGSFLRTNDSLAKKRISERAKSLLTRPQPSNQQ
ncbi:MAG: hypothetical protein ABIR56_07995, partial [Polaromonas sp.]